MLLIIGIMFLMLKLAGVVSWAWWIVLIPFYPAILGMLVVLGCFLLAGVFAVFDGKFLKK